MVAVTTAEEPDERQVGAEGHGEHQHDPDADAIQTRAGEDDGRPCPRRPPTRWSSYRASPSTTSFVAVAAASAHARRRRRHRPRRRSLLRRHRTRVNGSPRGVLRCVLRGADRLLRGVAGVRGLLRGRARPRRDAVSRAGGDGIGRLPAPRCRRRRSPVAELGCALAGLVHGVPAASRARPAASRVASAASCAASRARSATSAAPSRTLSAAPDTASFVRSTASPTASRALSTGVGSSSKGPWRRARGRRRWWAGRRRVGTPQRPPGGGPPRRPRGPGAGS